MKFTSKPLQCQAKKCKKEEKIRETWRCSPWTCWWWPSWLACQDERRQHRGERRGGDSSSTQCVCGRRCCLSLSLSLCLSVSLSLLWFKLIRSFSPPGSFGFGVLIERDEEKAMVWCRFGYATWVLSFVEKNYNKLCFLIWVFWI